jgi:hypothetical protein
MFRTENSVGMLKSIAMIAGLAILLWSLGLPSIRFADAANVTTFSDTLSDSTPSAVSDHTIDFVSPTGVTNSNDIVVTFPAGFDLTGIGAEDIDLFVDDADFLAANWSVVNGGSDLTITIDTGAIAAAASTSIRIGNHAVGAATDTQIVNPAAEGSFEITVTAGAAAVDSGTTQVVILTGVTVTAAVDTVFTFAVAGTAAGTEMFPAGETSTGVTGSTSVPFGTLAALTASSGAQQLAVTTNSANGYVVTVQLSGAFESSTGADIDGFNTDSDTPTSWSSPTSPDIGDENTWGYWGITSDDTAIASRGTQFANDLYIAASTTPREVMQYDGPVNGTGQGQGTTTVGYKVEISSLQEAGDDYTTTLTYVATPTF